MREVNHRVKNQFAVILSMVRETSKRSTDPHEFEHPIPERIMALSRSHDLLVKSEWSGASFFDLIQEHLKPFAHEEQISLSGPLIVLQPNAVQHLGMAFHELGTNSSKYGALSSNVGTVLVTWEIVTAKSGRREIELVWEEASGASPGDRPEKSSRKGFGSIVLERVTPQGLNGISLLERWSGRVRWALSAPLEAITVPPAIAELTIPIAG